MLLLIAVGVASSAAAQQYQADPSFDPKASIHRLLVPRMIKDAALYSSEKAKFDEFFTKYYFPAMTRPSPEALAELGKLRYELFQRNLWATSNEQLQRDLTVLAFRAMKNIVEDQNAQYHPAVRYNAVLVLGMLDAQYAIEGQRPPKPLPGVTRILTGIVNSATANDAYPPVVILGALVGLERHAQYRESLPKDAVDAMPAALVKLVNHDEPIQEMDPEAYAWMRMRAAGVLAQLGSPGANGEVHAALVKLANDSKSLDDRTAAAGLLDKLNYEGAKIDAPATVDVLLKLASDLGAAEAKRAREFDASATGLTGVGAAPAYTDPYGAQEVFPRRQVLARLLDLRRGLRKVKPLADEDAQVKLEAVDKAIGPVITATADKNLIDLRITEAIRAMASAIEAAVPSQAPPTEELPAEEAATEEAPPEEAPAEQPTAEAPPTAAETQ